MKLTETLQSRIYEGMKDLCTRFCVDEMIALLNIAPEARIQKSDTWKSDEDFGEEEPEEPE
jgi:hypothetical protein